MRNDGTFVIVRNCRCTGLGENQQFIRVIEMEGDQARIEASSVRCRPDVSHQYVVRGDELAELKRHFETVDGSGTTMPAHRQRSAAGPTEVTQAI